MSIVEVEPDRWIVDLGGGWALEVLVAGALSAGFWRYRGELVSEAW